jgi:hypothetical protein
MANIFLRSCSLGLRPKSTSHHENFARSVRTVRRKCVLCPFSPRHFAVVLPPHHQFAIVLLTPPFRLVPRHEEIKGRRTFQEEVSVQARLLLLWLVGYARVRFGCWQPLHYVEKSTYAYEAHPPQPNMCTLTY